MKTVVVTGANRGLGHAITRRLLADGYRVVGVARNETSEVAALGGMNFRFIPFDLGNTADIYGLCQSISRDEKLIYALVNNAALGLDGILATQHERDIERMFRVNLLAPVLLTKYLSRTMLISGTGRIVHVSSIMAENGFSGLAVYGATKAGLVGFAKSLSREVGKVGITVNCVNPGFMETEMTDGLVGEKLESIRRRSPFRAFPTVDDVAGAVAFLLGPDAKMITGTTITVDAGSTA